MYVSFRLDQGGTMYLTFRRCFRALIALTACAVTSTSTHAVDVTYILNDVAITNQGDVLITDFLLDRGYTLNLVGQSEDAVTTLEASDAADLTIVSESVGSSNVNTEVKDSITPVITAEGFLFDDMGYGIGPAESTSETDITIIEPDHPLAAGLPAGDVAIYDGPGFMSWAEIGGDVTVIATIPFDPAESAAIFVYERGALLDDGTEAPAMRIGLPHSGQPCEGERQLS